MKSKCGSSIGQESDRITTQSVWDLDWSDPSAGHAIHEDETASLALGVRDGGFVPTELPGSSLK